MILADIFIPTSKNLKTISSCLNHLNKQTLKSFRILLVGKEPNKQLRKLIGTYPKLKIKYFIQQKPGLTNAAIEALNTSRAQIFIRIDDDVEVNKKWFEQIIKPFNQDKKIGGVTGPTLLTDKGYKSRDAIMFLKDINKKNFIVRKIIKSYLYENKIRDVGKFLSSGNFTIGANFITCVKYRNDFSVDNFEACNFACRTSLIKKLGGFDPLFARGLGEYHEADAARKIIESGYKIVFSPKAIVWHKVENGGSADIRPDARYRIFNFIIFYRKHFVTSNKRSILKFFANVFMQDMYYLYKFLKSHDVNQLSSLLGTLDALSYKL